MQKCCHAESHFLKTTGVAEGEEREEGQWRWRCTVSPGDPLQLRTGSLEMNETPGHTDSPGPGGAGKPESRGELGGFLSPPPVNSPGPGGAARPPGPMLRAAGVDRPPAHTHRRPRRSSPLGSAPPPPRPGRAPLPLPGAGTPGPAEWVSACPRARAEARPPSPSSPLRAPELRWEPPRAERPESAPQRRA